MKDNMKCKHQWIKIKKLMGRTEKNKKAQAEEYKRYEKAREIKRVVGMMPVLVMPDKTGVLVKCVECEEQREIWEDKPPIDTR